MTRVPLLSCQLVRDRSDPASSASLVDAPGKAAALARAVVGDADREHFGVILVDARNRAQGVNIVSVGTLTASLVHPREVFKPAILASAAAVVLFHNHPSGDPKPSPEDRETTKLGMTMGLVDVVGTPTANAAEKAAKAAADVAEKTAEAWAEAFDGVDYTNMAEAITSNLAEQLDRDAAELLSQIPDSPTVSPLAGQYAAMQARQTQAESAYYSGLGDQVMGGSGRPGQVIQAGVQGGQAGGAPGALAAVGTDLLMHSEAFASMLEKTTGILQTLADTVGIVLEPALDAISWVFEQVARIILNVIKAILVVLDKLPGIDFGDEIKKIDSKLKGLGKSAEDAGKEIGKTFSSANVPQGFKTAMAQADATKGIVVQNLTVTADDTKKIKKELTAEAERRLHAGSTTEAK